MEILTKLSKSEYLEHEAASENPVLIRNEQMEAALSAYKALSKIILNMQKQYDLSDEDVKILLEEVRSIYLRKKGESFLKGKMDVIAVAIRNLLRNYLQENPNKRNTDQYYCNLIRHSYKHEF